MKATVINSTNLDDTSIVTLAVEGLTCTATYTLISTAHGSDILVHPSGKHEDVIMSCETQNVSPVLRAIMDALEEVTL